MIAVTARPSGIAYSLLATASQALETSPDDMWHLVLYHGRKNTFGRLLILSWIVFAVVTALLFVFPKSFGQTQPAIGVFAPLLVLTTIAYGVLLLWRAGQVQHKTQGTGQINGVVPKPSGAIRVLVGVVVLSSFVWFFWFQKESVGYSAQVSDGAMRVSAGSSPAILLWSCLGIVLFGILMKADLPKQIGEFQIPSMSRRLCAFLLDFWFALFTLSGLFGILPVLLEARRTGVFQWHFQRDYVSTSDWFNVAAVFVFMGAVLLYFALPLARRKQTVGCWVLRLATIRPSGDVLYLPLSVAMWRVFKEFTGVCSPWKTLGQRDAQGRTWYDRETGFMVVRY